MKVGFVQLAPLLADVNGTIALLAALEPSFESADLMVLPELCNSGYNFGSFDEAWEHSEEVSRSVFIDFLVDVCIRHRMHIVSGFNERSGKVLYNSAVLVGPRGVIGLYRKMHLFLNEKDIFQPGNAGLPVYEVNGTRIGTLICFDWRFPEVWRILALRGADIIAHPSNLVIPGQAQRVVPTHALINGVFVITANRIGTEGNLKFTGASLVCGPRGELLASAPEEAECVMLVDIDPLQARNKDVTTRNNIIADRRPEEYSVLGQPRPSATGNRENAQ